MSKRRIKKIVAGSTLLACGAFIAGFVWLWWNVSPVNSSDTAIRTIIVSKGETGSSIAASLQSKQIIKSSFMLRLMLRSKDSTAIIQTGTYELAPSMRVSEVADALLKGSKDMWVTLLEGWRAEEVGEELTTKFGIRYFNPTEFGKLAKDKEGMLFPDTYLFPKQTSAQAIIDTLTSTFEKKYQKAVDELGTPALPKDQTIVLASLIEREARDPASMKIVAGILLNRVNAGIPLQVDSTLQYIKGYDTQLKTWWPTPKASDKQRMSPLNTYMNRGMPPAPICNPGINALRAAIAPADTEYVYYISDMSGGMHYAKTLEEHNANVDRYLR